MIIARYFTFVRYFWITLLGIFLFNLWNILFVFSKPITHNMPVYQIISGLQGTFHQGYSRFGNTVYFSVYVLSVWYFTKENLDIKW